MNILITGSNGQLGTKFKEVVDNTYHVNNYIFANRYDLDITNQEMVCNYIKFNDIDVILNCAAYTNVDKAEDDKENAKNVNTYACAYLAEAANENDVFLIHISTDYVFDGESNIPKKETDEPNPIGVYGNTKLNGEICIIMSGCKHLIFRTSWLYSDLENNFVSKMYNRLHDMNNVKVVFDQIGSPTNAEDLAEFLFELIECNHYDEARGGLYHFANKGVASWYDLTMSVAEYGNFGKYNGLDMVGQVEPCLSNEYKTKAKRPHYSVLNTSRLENEFNWYDLPYWRDSLKKTIIKLNKKYKE